MAAHKTQRYLEKHKIGPLFESLMAQLIQDTPDDPVSYMIRTLQGMQKKHKIFEDLNGDNSFASNVSPQRSAKRSSLDGDVTPRHSNLAASWSVGERPKMPEQHRPRTSMKKTMESNTWSRGQIIQVSDSQPAWNNDTRVPTHDFDEWLHLQKDNDEKPSDKDIKEKYRGVKSWGAQESSVSKGKSDEKDSQFVGSDDLSNELNLGKYQKLSSDTTVNRSSVSPMSITRSRPSKAKQAVEEHRQHLQDLLLNDNGYDTKKLGSGKYSPDEGMEILENIDELRQEGVSNGVVTKGAKLNKLKQKQEQVSVTICARCARIITGTEMNTSSDLGSFLNGSNENRSLSAVDRVTWKEDIDDDSRDKFETASEASDILGTSRRKEWPIASDTESDITPRNNVTSSSRGKRYLENRSRREKSTSSPLPSSRPSSSRSRKSDISLTKHGVGKAWRPVNEFSSDNETEIESVLSHGSRSMNGQPWKIPSDNDSDNGSNPPHTGRSKGFSSKKPNKGRKSRSFISDTTSSIGGDTDF